MKYFLCLAGLFFCVKSGLSFTVSGIEVVNSYPMNGAINVHPMTGIGVTYSGALQKNVLSGDSIDVYGNLGEKYPGSVKISSNGRTLIFTPSNSFPLGETIHVRIGSLQTIENTSTLAYSLTFTIRKKIAVPDTGFHSDDPILDFQLHKNLRNQKYTNGASQTQDFPILNVNTENNPTDGYMYISNYKFLSEQANTYRMILNNYAEVINAQGGGPDYFVDFKPNPDHTYSYYDYFAGAFIILDSNLNNIKSISATNGYLTDPHEFRVTSEGNHIIIASDNEIVDMTKYIQGAWTTATILVPIIQEFDRDNNLIFEWRTIDHFMVTDATHEDLLIDYIDFCHLNAIEFDGDSNFVISSRHMDEITKINRETGEIMWRWGGKNNQFTFTGDTLLFSHQHGVRRTDSGTITMFDNGNFHPIAASYSRAVEYNLDETNMIAKKIWEFRHIPDISSQSMGYVQRLPNQNTFIGWGQCDYVTATELDPENRTLFEMGMTDGNYSYRAYKYDTNYVKPITTTTNAVKNTSLSALTASLVCMPNPITDKGQIECTVDENSFTQILLFDQLGREVLTIYTGDLSPGKHSYMISAGALPAGMYYLRAVGSGGNSLEKKILIIK